MTIKTDVKPTEVFPTLIGPMPARVTLDGFEEGPRPFDLRINETSAKTADPKRPVFRPRNHGMEM